MKLTEENCKKVFQHQKEGIFSPLFLFLKQLCLIVFVIPNCRFYRILQKITDFTGFFDKVC